MKMQIHFSRKTKFLKFLTSAYKNALFVRKSFKKENLSLFNDMFTLLNTNHDYITRAGSKNILDKPPSQSTHYGENSIRAKALSNWNLLQRITNVNLLTCDLHEFKNNLWYLLCQLPINYITIIKNTENKQGYYYHYYYLGYYYFYYIASIIIVNFKDHKHGQTIKRLIKTFYLFLIYIVACK